MIAFLHTSEIHVERFEKLIKKYNDSIPTKHFVNESLLDIASRTGKVDQLLFRQEIECIKAYDPLLIICTCSTYGEECDKYSMVYRIDKPVVEFMVKHYRKIGLVYTADSTQKVSERLVSKTALELNQQVDIIDCDCSEYWKDFLSGNLTDYYKGIAKNIMLIESQVDGVFLAQASMEGTKQYLDNLSIEVFSSPDFGVQKILQGQS